MRPRLDELVNGRMVISYVGRVPSASPATGSYAIHELEQQKIVEDALALGEKTGRASEAA